jgi:hypothetical protein
MLLLVHPAATPHMVLQMVEMQVRRRKWDLKMGRPVNMSKVRPKSERWEGGKKGGREGGREGVRWLPMWRRMKIDSGV